MIDYLQREGWEKLPSGKDFVKGKLLLSSFRSGWQLFHMEQREFLLKGKEEFKPSDVKVLESW